MAGLSTKKDGLQLDAMANSGVMANSFLSFQFCILFEIKTYPSEAVIDAIIGELVSSLDLVSDVSGSNPVGTLPVAYCLEPLLYQDQQLKLIIKTFAKDITIANKTPGSDPRPTLLRKLQIPRSLNKPC